MSLGKLSHAFCFMTFTLSGLLWTGCGSEENDGGRSGSLQRFQNQEVLVLNGAETLNLTEAQIAGTGTIAFVSSLGSANGGAHFDFTGSLADGGSLTLWTFGTKNGSGAVSYRFSRSGNSLLLSYESGGVTQDLTESLNSADATTDFHFWIDVHNNESPLHTLMWLPSGITKEDLGEADAFFNSEELLTPAERESGNYSFPHVSGAGSFWGFELQDAVLSKASTGEPLYEEGDE